MYAALARGCASCYTPTAMPSVSAPQHFYMEKIAHDRAFAAQEGVPMKVGRDYVMADKAAHKHFRRNRRRNSHGKGRIF